MLSITVPEALVEILVCTSCKYHFLSSRDAAACCIVASEDFVHKHELENQAIEIVAQALTTDNPSAFDSRSAMELVGYSMSKVAADKAFAQAGFKQGEGRDLVGVVELHDCFSANEVSLSEITINRALLQLYFSSSHTLPLVYAR